jgi:thiamine-monophosphate kinase
MAATPAWCTLALTLPTADNDWLDAFLDGFLELAEQYDVQLIGGDTTRGPLSITVTVHGLIPNGQALRRDGARVGDEIWVTGTLGDAAGGLRQWQAKKLQSAKLRYRLDRPTPRIEAGVTLRNAAHAAIDLSDGLAGDLGHILESSGVGAEIDLGRLPTSATLQQHFPVESERWRLQLAGGDDYELCFTAPAAEALAMAACETTVTVIGQITSGRELIFRTPDGEAYSLPSAGYEHFTAGSA